MKGMGELHLDIKVDILKRTYKVEANIGAPQVAYRESLGKQGRHRLHPQEADGRHGPVRPRQAHLRAGRAGLGLRVRKSQDRRRQRCRRSSSLAFEKGLDSAKDNGLLAGFPLIDFKATLTDGAFHDVDSSVLAFEIASRAAFRELREKGAPKLLEPIMKVEVLTPGRIPWRRHRRPEQPSWPDSGHRPTRQRPGDHRLRAAGEHVRLRLEPARDEPGPSPVHHAV